MNKSFTLIEILVVIVIIGIISGFIIVGMAGVSDKANIAKGQAFAGSLKNSLMLNLISEWRLDETSGTTAKDYWDSNNGTWDGVAGAYTSPSWRTASECVSNGCLAFDGTDDYVDCGINDSLKAPNELTIGAWVNLVSYDSHWRGIMATREDWGTGIAFWLNQTGNIYFSAAGTHYNFSTVVPLNKWKYLTVTFSLANQEIITYMDGVASAPQSRSSALPNFPITRIGIQAVGVYPLGYAQWNGKIDDVRLYNVAIPSSKIQENYYSGLNNLFKNKSISREEYLGNILELAIH